jgi:hypothetical protein
MICWVVRVDRSWCVFEHFEEALGDWKTHDGFRWIYPKLMTRKRFQNLPEHNGW